MGKAIGIAQNLTHKVNTYKHGRSTCKVRSAANSLLGSLDRAIVKCMRGDLQKFTSESDVRQIIAICLSIAEKTAEC